MVDHNKMEIMADYIIEPNDIIWTNMGGERGIYFCRRLLLNFAIVLILLFLTTPTVLKIHKIGCSFCG